MSIQTNNIPNPSWNVPAGTQLSTTTPDLSNANFYNTAKVIGVSIISSLGISDPSASATINNLTSNLNPPLSTSDFVNYLESVQSVLSSASPSASATYCISGALNVVSYMQALQDGYDNLTPAAQTEFGPTITSGMNTLLESFNSLPSDGPSEATFLKNLSQTTAGINSALGVNCPFQLDNTPLQTEATTLSSSSAQAAATSIFSLASSTTSSYQKKQGTALSGAITSPTPPPAAPVTTTTPTTGTTTTTPTTGTTTTTPTTGTTATTPTTGTTATTSTPSTTATTTTTTTTTPAVMNYLTLAQSIGNAMGLPSTAIPSAASLTETGFVSFIAGLQTNNSTYSGLSTSMVLQSISQLAAATATTSGANNSLFSGLITLLSPSSLPTNATTFATFVSTNLNGAITKTNNSLSTLNVTTPLTSYGGIYDYSLLAQSLVTDYNALGLTTAAPSFTSPLTESGFATFLSNLQSNVSGGGSYSVLSFSLALQPIAQLVSGFNGLAASAQNSNGAAVTSALNNNLLPLLSQATTINSPSTFANFLQGLGGLNGSIAAVNEIGMPIALSSLNGIYDYSNYATTIISNLQTAGVITQAEATTLTTSFATPLNESGLSNLIGQLQSDINSSGYTGSAASLTLSALEQFVNSGYTGSNEETDLNNFITLLSSLPTSASLPSESSYFTSTFIPQLNRYITSANTDLTSAGITTTQISTVSGIQDYSSYANTILANLVTAGIITQSQANTITASLSSPLTEKALGSLITQLQSYADTATGFSAAAISLALQPLAQFIESGYSGSSTAADLTTLIGLLSGSLPTTASGLVSYMATINSAISSVNSTLPASSALSTVTGLTDYSAIMQSVLTDLGYTTSTSPVSVPTAPVSENQFATFISNLQAKQSTTTYSGVAISVALQSIAQLAAVASPVAAADINTNLLPMLKTAANATTSTFGTFISNINTAITNTNTDLTSVKATNISTITGIYDYSSYANNIITGLENAGVITQAQVKSSGITIPTTGPLTASALATILSQLQTLAGSASSYPGSAASLAMQAISQLATSYSGLTLAQQSSYGTKVNTTLNSLISYISTSNLNISNLTGLSNYASNIASLLTAANTSLSGSGITLSTTEETVITDLQAVSTYQTQLASDQSSLATLQGELGGVQGLTNLNSWEVNGSNKNDGNTVGFSNALSSQIYNQGVVPLTASVTSAQSDVTTDTTNLTNAQNALITALGQLPTTATNFIQMQQLNVQVSNCLQSSSNMNASTLSTIVASMVGAQNSANVTNMTSEGTTVLNVLNVYASQLGALAALSPGSSSAVTSALNQLQSFAQAIIANPPTSQDGVNAELNLIQSTITSINGATAATGSSLAALQFSLPSVATVEANIENNLQTFTNGLPTNAITSSELSAIAQGTMTSTQMTQLVNALPSGTNLASLMSFTSEATTLLANVLTMVQAYQSEFVNFSLSSPLSTTTSSTNVGVMLENSKIFEGNNLTPSAQSNVANAVSQIQNLASSITTPLSASSYQTLLQNLQSWLNTLGFGAAPQGPNYVQTPGNSSISAIVTAATGNAADYSISTTASQAYSTLNNTTLGYQINAALTALNYITALQSSDSSELVTGGANTTVTSSYLSLMQMLQLSQLPTNIASSITFTTNLLTINNTLSTSTGINMSTQLNASLSVLNNMSNLAAELASTTSNGTAYAMWVGLGALFQFLNPSLLPTSSASAFSADLNTVYNQYYQWA